MELLNKDLRKKILEKGSEKNLGHFGSALSCVDAIKYLYDNVLTEEDIFILSKGHAAMALYSVLESKGKKVDWTTHPEFNPEQGIHATTGSLGHGLPIALGRALGKKLNNKSGRVYVLVGDGEIQEGSNWEAMMIASKLGVNFNILVDYNKYQALGCVKNILNIDLISLVEKLRAFNCNVIVIDGHDINELSKLKNIRNGVNAIVLDTIKGKGCPLLEKTHDHVVYWKDYQEEYKRTLDMLSS
ncbi:hypothetical protein HYW76_04195 [Candidatus Pacearchaeota archaeon]|nr:hypothetical protein [Candidatus Pacearchaeota archaeon]